MVRLSGTGLIADDLWLMAHDDITGRPFLQPRAAGLGLAGGLLAELTLRDNICLSNGWLIAGDQPPPRDELGRRVLRLVAGEREPRPVRDWLAFLARAAVTDVAARLERSGYLACAGRWPRRAGRWVPVDSDCAFAPLTRARMALEASGHVATRHVVLAGLAVACGLGPRLLPYGPPGARERLDREVARLAPGLRELVACTRVAVDAAVLAQRL